MLSDYYQLKKTSAIGILLWILGLIFAMIFMSILGVDPSDPNLEWGINHEQYWNFQVLQTPTFLLIGLAFLLYIFKKSEIDKDKWVVEGLATGVTIMMIQFFLDVIVIVGLFQNDFFDYFIAIVTISYLLIPVWSFITIWYWKKYRSSA